MNNNKIKNNKINVNNDDNNIKLIKINKKSNKNSDNNVNKNSNKNSNKKSNKNSDNNVNKNSNKNSNNIDNNKKISYKITETEYERPIMTYTDKLSTSQIQELLIDYEQIKNIEELMKVPIGTHLRYFDNKNNQMKFRTGGILTVNTGLPDYIILSSGHVSWSVQTNTSIFFRRITLKQLKEEFDIINKKNLATIAGLQELLSDNSTKIKQQAEYIKKLEQKLKIKQQK